METRGHVRQFGSYTTQQLERMKADLGLHMPLPKLTFCASYYRNHEKRDPSIEEIQLLDLFSEATRELPHSIAPVELLTNDTFVAQTYADMMKKRRELNPDAKAPATLAEMMNLAGAYLGRIGKTPSLPATLFLLENGATATGQASNSTVSPNGGFTLHSLKKEKQTHDTGDLLVLLRPVMGLGVTGGKAPLSRLLERANLTDCFKTLRTVGKQGLLYEILNLTQGAQIELSRLSETGEPLPISMLVSAYEGDLLVRISPDRFQAFAATSHRLGIRTFAFATVKQESRIAILRNAKNLFSFAYSFLRALSPLHAASVKLGNEKQYTPAPILHTPRSAAPCKYIAQTTNAPNDLTVNQNLLCAVAASQPKNGFFRNALETALAPVLMLAASGCDFSAQRCAVGLTLPQNSTDPLAAGEALSALLGLYRLQAELALPLASGKITTDAKLCHPEITVFGMGEGTPCPNQFTGEGNHVYCIAPELQASGIPDFTALRKMLDTLSSLRRRGILTSARVLCREDVTDGIRLMSNNMLTCKLRGNVLFSCDTPPIAILIECTETIDAAEIGVVTARAKVLPTPTQKVLPERDCLISPDRAEITIFSDVHDGDAKCLAERLSLSDAHVTHILAEDGCADRLSRAIMTSQTLIICGRVSLPQTVTLTFATDTLHRGGGRVLLLGGAEVCNFVNGFALPEGITERIIEQITKIKKDCKKT